VPDNKTTSQNSPVAGARAFADSAEAAVAYLEQHFPKGMEPLQVALAARIRHATAQLLACADQLDTDELMVLGSTGQRIPHPLLKTEHALRKEISDGLKELTFRTQQAVMFLEARALTRDPRVETEDES
jgi:thiamine pyrophosphokinase